MWDDRHSIRQRTVTCKLVIRVTELGPPAGVASAPIGNKLAVRQLSSSATGMADLGISEETTRRTFEVLQVREHFVLPTLWHCCREVLHL
jgi:hypothetical protein